jgi:hypothetical protein
MEEKEIQEEMAEAILGIPFVFELGRKKYRIAPATLGKIIRLKTYTQALGIADVESAEQVAQAVMRDPMAAARVAALFTLDKVEDIKDRQTVEKRAQTLMKDIEYEDLTKLTYMCLQRERQADRLMKAVHIDKEIERRRKVIEAKQSRNTYYFGGVTIYGQLIDLACERYGWTLDYVLWGISYTNLQMLMADQYSTVFLTDEEAKGCRVPRNGDEVFMADDPKNFEILKRMINGGS